jgi:hypothetical protein
MREPVIECVTGGQHVPGEHGGPVPQHPLHGASVEEVPVCAESRAGREAKTLPHPPSLGKRVGVG